MPKRTPLETLFAEIGQAFIKFSGTAPTEAIAPTSEVEELEVEVEVEVEEEKPKTRRGRKPASKPKTKVEEPEEDEDEDEEDDDELTRADLEGKSLRQLRTLAEKIGYEKDDVANANKEDLIESILNPDDDEEDEDDVEENEDGVDTDKLVASLEKLTLTGVKKVAREDHGFKASDYKGMDKDAIIEMIVDKVSGSEVEDDDEEDEPYTEEELDAMSMAELKAICKEWGIKMKVGQKKDEHIDAILSAQEDED